MSAATISPALPRLGFSGQQYSEHQRNDWDASAFAQIFDGTDGVRRVGEGGTTEKSSAPARFDLESTAPQSVDAEMTSVVFELSSCGFNARGAASVQQVAGGAVLPSEEPVPGTAVSVDMNALGGTADDASGSVLPVISDAVTSSFSHMGADSMPAELVLVAGERNRLMCVAVRTVRLPAHQLASLLSRIRAELSWQGMGLEALTVNGQAVYRAGKDGQPGSITNTLQDA